MKLSYGIYYALIKIYNQIEVIYTKKLHKVCKLLQYKELNTNFITLYYL